ncbi:MULTISPECIES: hypothetical protein [Sinorhizobium]|uniref:hypothetical protein n=1 Tax=Sinorhizobium TaxID=28105 RepID=UPI000BE7E7E6|nr:MULTISPECIES: hypothetical protein [Sinorhizobium]PDT50045.1 hypothetical protein CO664_26375 [Sinorhizobium sp. NG07B]POH33692.1 hypothetical protein ATY30_01530 [Sinorhizobium americanum]
MGDRQTTFVMLVWLVATLLFFGLIGFRLWDQGLDWLRQSTEPLVAVGIIALSCYLALMFSQSNSEAKKERDRRARDHTEMMREIRALDSYLTAQMRGVASAVDDLDRNRG